MTLLISERRAIGERAATDFDFRTLLQASPQQAVEQVVGRPVAETIDIVEENNGWTFVLIDPSAIEKNIADPTDSRSAIENHAYALLRDNPALADDAERAPREFASSKLGIDLPAELALTVRREAPGEIVLVVRNRHAHEELDDNALDLVSAGHWSAGGANTGGKG